MSCGIYAIQYVQYLVIDALEKTACLFHVSNGDDLALGENHGAILDLGRGARFALGVNCGASSRKNYNLCKSDLLNATAV